MTNAEFDFSKLSVAERIPLAEDLWDSIPESADIALTGAQKAEQYTMLEDNKNFATADLQVQFVRVAKVDS